MATIGLTFTPEVADSPTVIAQSVNATPYTLPTYGGAAWYEVGRLTWTAVLNDIVAATAFCNMTVSAVTATGTDRLALYMRGRLINTTTGLEVWAGTCTELVYHRIGTVDFGNLFVQASINERFTTKDLLTAGQAYKWAVEVMKEQDFGVATMSVIVNDASVFSDAAKRNP